MITISNPKVAGFAPRWATFRGFTILFDNPGDSFARHENRIEVACDVDGDAALGFYRALRDSLATLNLDTLTNTYLFCPLPPASYHVTLWDGCNDGNLQAVHAEQRPTMAEFLDGLPSSHLRPSAATKMAAASPLVTRRGWGIRLRFERLVKWDNIGMVALLAPADESRSYAELLAERAQLSARFRHTFGISPSEQYRPHVSLGYFANQEAAQLSTPCIEAWSRDFAARMHGLTLEFQQASVYGFTNMIGFFKPAGDV